MTRYRCAALKVAPFIAAGILVLLTLSVTQTWAGQMKPATSYPVANQIMTGNDGLAFALRFHAPVSHTGSHLVLLTPTGSRVIRLRLDSDPHTLAGVVGKLGPGGYELQWSAKAVDGEATAGTIPFMVIPFLPVSPPPPFLSTSLPAD